ncbi:MAG: flagellar motor protein MotB [Proteobacteria bacterium]|nr:flagellar motor protein MotB [Pseudomonadota bacterium]
MSETTSTTESHYIPQSKPKRFSNSKGEGLWLMSFGDLCLILISFFILLLSFSSISQKKADIMREAVKPTPVATKKQDSTSDSLAAVTRKIESAIKRLKLDQNAHVTFDDAGVAIEFKDGLLFSVGSATSNAAFTEVVNQIMKVIALTPDKYHLRIEGHTDDVPIKSGQFASNWELSSARGISLMRQFVQKGVQENRVSVLAYAHTRPKRPVEGLKGAELDQARAANRRVVVRIEPKP